MRYILDTSRDRPVILKRQANGTYVRIAQVFDEKDGVELVEHANREVGAKAGY